MIIYYQIKFLLVTTSGYLFMLSLEIENVISVPSAARVNFKVYGEMLPLNIHFFVVYALAVAIMYHF